MCYLTRKTDFRFSTSQQILNPIQLHNACELLAKFILYLQKGDKEKIAYFPLSAVTPTVLRGVDILAT